MTHSKRRVLGTIGLVLAYGVFAPQAEANMSLSVGVIGSAAVSQAHLHRKISDSLKSSASLEASGVSKFQLKFKAEALKVNFKDNQLSDRRETLVFQPDAAIREVDGAERIYTENLSLPYCLLRVEREWVGEENEVVAVPMGTQRAFDRFLPGMLRYSERYMGEEVVHQLIIAIETGAPEDQVSTKGVSFQELECHMTDEHLRNETLAGVLTRVLGKHVEITYSFE